MRDVRKVRPEAVKKHHNTSSRKRKRRRKRNLKLYYLLIFFFVLLAGVALSLTVFFNIEEFVVVGDTIYDASEIKEASGIKIGDNLFRIKSGSIEQKVISKLPYIEEVKLKRSLPSKLTITTKKARPYANIGSNDKYYLISTSGRILEELSKPQEDLIIVKGYNPAESKVGEYITPEFATKHDLLVDILSAIESADISHIKSINIADSIGITLNYDNRIDILIGSAADIDYKLAVAKGIIDDRANASEKGTINVQSSDYPSFLGKDDG